MTPLTAEPAAIVRVLAGPAAQAIATARAAQANYGHADAIDAERPPGVLAHKAKLQLADAIERLARNRLDDDDLTIAERALIRAGGLILADLDRIAAERDARGGA